MFSNLASYLGYVSTSPADPNNVTADVRLRAVEEDDWVLVERNELGGSMSTTSVGGESEEDTGMTRVSLAISTCPSTLPGSSKSLTRSSSLDIPCPLQESWYLTPPPSFTSEGPVHMETSPLENLLIEHPSMSVYQHTQRVRKSSNSSPPSSSTSEEEPTLRPSSPTRLPRKEKLNKLPRNKLNTKFSKKLSSKRPPGSSSDDGVPVHPPIEEQESKEPKMKSFVKSPRRSINSELKNLTKKSPRKRFDTSSSDEMISIPSATEDDENTMTSQPEQPITETVQTKKLYSEVLASKPKVAEVKQEAPALEKKQTVPSPVVPTRETPTAVESESVMSIEEQPEERDEIERDRRRTVQTISDQQHRQHFLNRSAQKMEQRKTCDLIKRNPLIRTNKAREINFRNKRQRRADMMQRHSGANNNRKC